MTLPALAHYQHWVFDMDGTLTVSVHDFPAIRRHLGVPAEADVLTHLDTLPAEARREKHAWLLAHERALALDARAARGAVALVRRLCERGCRLGILTRNARELAHITLEAIGLADCFEPESILGRDEATPKPDPEGLAYFTRYWRIPPQAMVMVGDSRTDLACGRAAGTRTLLVNTPGDPWPELTDWRLDDCRALLECLNPV